MNRAILRESICLRWLGLLGLSLIGALGCGGSSDLVPVSGQVTLDGEPLPDVQVLFYQRGGGPETNFIGQTDGEGRFTLTTIRGESAGIAPGKYDVSLTTAFAGPETLETDPIPPERVPEASRRMEYEVPSDGLEELQLDLKSK